MVASVCRNCQERVAKQFTTQTFAIVRNTEQLGKGLAHPLKFKILSLAFANNSRNVRPLYRVQNSFGDFEDWYSIGVWRPQAGLPLTKGLRVRRGSDCHGPGLGETQENQASDEMAAKRPARRIQHVDGMAPLGKRSARGPLNVIFRT